MAGSEMGMGQWCSCAPELLCLGGTPRALMGTSGCWPGCCLGEHPELVWVRGPGLTVVSGPLVCLAPAPICAVEVQGDSKQWC